MTMRSAQLTIILVLAIFAVVGEPCRAQGENTARGWWADAAPEGSGQIAARLSPDVFTRWINTGSNNRPIAPGAVTLYRWWTDTCPFCEASLPAVETLRKDFGPRGLAVVAVYHPKPPRPVTDEVIRAAAKAIGFDGPIAVDLDWSVLKKFWLSTGRRQATSVTFLVDGKGVIRYIHPGPDFYASDKPEDAVQNQDFAALREAVGRLFDEAGAEKPATRPTTKQ